MIPNIVNTIQHCEAVCESMTDYIENRPDINSRTKQLELLRDCAKHPDVESQNCSRVCLHCAKECKEFSMRYGY